MIYAVNPNGGIDNLNSDMNELGDILHGSFYIKIGIS